MRIGTDLIRVLVSLVLFMLVPFRYCWGQITNVTNDTSTPIPGAGHDYFKLLNETVNPANGSLSLRIGVPMPPGRRLTVPFSFDYDSNGVHHLFDMGVGEAAGAAIPPTSEWEGGRTVFRS